MLVLLVKHSLPEEPPELLIDTYPLWAGVAVFLVFAALICQPAVWLALSARFGGNYLTWFLGVVCLGPLIVTLIFAALFGLGLMDPSFTLGAFTFGLGVAGTTLVVLLITRALGYRLIRPDSPSSDTSK